MTDLDGRSRTGASPTRSARTLLPRIALGAGALVGVVLAVVVGLSLLHRGEALPGVHVEAVDVGGLSADTVAARVEPLVARRAATPVVLTLDDRRFEVTADQVDFGIDVDETVRRALSAGREGNLFSDAWASVSALWTDREVDLGGSLDPEQLQRRVAEIAEQVDSAPFPGAIVVDTEGPTITEQLPKPGYSVQREKTAQTVLTGLHSGEPSRPLPVTVTEPEVADAVIHTVAAQAREAVSEPFRVTSEDGDEALSPPTVAGWLGSEVVQGPDGTTVRLAVNPTAIQQDLDAETDSLGRAPASARFAVAGAPPTVDAKRDLTWSPRPATVTVSGESRPGRRVDLPASVAAVEAAVRGGEHSAPLTMTLARAHVTTEEAHALGITHLIGTFTTYHACCQNRVHNIHRIADIVDGTVIKPGETFSINGIVGPRTRAKGFLPDGTIVNGEIVNTIGGGISQFGTTVFNAAFFAGLPITDYKAHSFYISRYPPGREATLSYPSLDVEWVNNTEHGILVDTRYTGTSLTVSLYGDNGGREVRAVTGPRVPVTDGAGGFRIEVTRIISGPIEDQRTFHTRYVDPPDGH